MALKGHVKIELKNVNTEEVETIESDNLVTNAVGNLLKPMGAFYPAEGTNVLMQNTYAEGSKINENLLTVFYGGLMLWDEEIEEDANNYRVPDNANMVGNACYSYINTGLSPYVGSYNLTESDISATGAKFVYDFNTSQGNGQISCISLVHRINGAAGFGIPAYSETQSVQAKCPNFNLNYAVNYRGTQALGNAQLIPLPASNIFAVVRNDNASNVVFERHFADLNNKISLFRGIDLFDPSPENIMTATHSELWNEPYLTYHSGGWHQAARYENGKAVFTYVCNQEPYTNMIKKVTVDLATWQKQEETYSNFVGEQPEGWVYIGEGYFYDNAAGVVWDSESGGDEKIAVPDLLGATNLANGIINSQKLAHISKNKVVVQSAMSNSPTIVDLATGNGLYCNNVVNLFTPSQATMGYNKILYPLSTIPKNWAYLGTINNLPEPVTKTSDKTMKVTYILAEDTSNE